MDGKVMAIAGAIALVGVILISQKAIAAEVYTCPYGDGLTFDSLGELQNHVAKDHPGERVPVSIRWS